MVDIFYPQINQSSQHVGEYFDRTPVRTGTAAQLNFGVSQQFTNQFVKSIIGNVQSSFSDEPLITPEEYKSSPYYREGIEVPEEGLKESVAEALANAYDIRYKRNLTFSRVKRNFGSQAAVFGAGMAGSGFDPYNMNQLCGIGLADLDSENAYYFPFRHQSDEPNLSQDQLKRLVEFINNTCKIVIGYNIKFDAKFLEKQGMNISDMQMIDVLVMVRMTEATTVNKLSLLDITIKDYGENAGQYDLDTDKILKSNRTDGVRWKDNYSLAPINTLGPYCIER